MELAIISRNPYLYSTRRLVEAAIQQHHTVRVVDPLRCMVHISAKMPGLIVNGARLPSLDAVIPRIGPSVTMYGLALVRQFEMMGVYMLNGSHAIAQSRDKLGCLQILSSSGITVPRTVFTNQPEHVREAIELVGGTPVVLKLMSSSQGMGVMLADTVQMARSVLDTFYSLGQSIFIQEYIAEANGQDLRAFVVGERIIAAIRRVAAAGDFRSNLHRGGTSHDVELPPEYAETAIRASRTMGLNVAGVDMLESKVGPMVLEVNSSPGLEGIETTTGADIAEEIVRFVSEKAQSTREQSAKTGLMVDPIGA